MKELAGNYVAKPGDIESLKQEIKKALKGPKRIKYQKTRQYRWEEIGEKLNNTIKRNELT